MLPPTDAPELKCEALIADGWRRVLVAENAQLDLSSPEALPVLRNGAQLVIDRFRPSSEPASRIAEAVRAAYELGNGRATFVERASGIQKQWFEHAACAKHGPVLTETLDPKNFSFNSRLGACADCQGLGLRRGIDLQRLFPNPNAGFWDALDGRVASTLRRSPRNVALIDALFQASAETLKTPVKKWGKPFWAAVMDGYTHDLSIKWKKTWGRSTQHVEEQRAWTGLRDILHGWNSRLEWLMDEQVCATCDGGRLQKTFLSVRMGPHAISDFVALTVDDAYSFVHALSLSGERAVISERPLTEIRRRLSFLRDVGLGYLSLERSAATLSGGEAQRIRLASQLGSGLSGVVYVLDEPTIGLHSRDTDRLLNTLEGLRDNGNTVILVEHDLDTIQRADHLIDLGPQAGEAGGQVVAVGAPREVAGMPASPTGQWLSGTQQLTSPSGDARGGRPYAFVAFRRIIYKIYR